MMASDSFGTLGITATLMDSSRVGCMVASIMLRPPTIAPRPSPAVDSYESFIMMRIRSKLKDSPWIRHQDGSRLVSILKHGESYH